MKNRSETIKNVGRIMTGLFLILIFFACSSETPEKKVIQPLKQKAEPKVVKLEWPFISEEEIEVSANLTAKNYILVFDGSGSMGETNCGAGRRKIDVAKEAVREWARSLPADANLGLVAFYYDRWAELPVSSGSRDKFESLVSSVKAGGKTPLTEALLRAFTQVTGEGKKQLGYGEYTIVVVTDGIANNRNSLSQIVKKVINTSPVNIYTIGFCIGQDHSLNQPGQTVYKSADNPEELKKGLSDVLAESETFDEGEFN